MPRAKAQRRFMTRLQHVGLVIYHLVQENDDRGRYMQPSQHMGWLRLSRMLSWYTLALSLSLYTSNLV